MIFFILLALHAFCRSDVFIYIESLCPNTKNAMKSISNTTIDNLDSIANVHFIPAGKYLSDGQIEVNTYFTKCQHEEKECYGNMLLACALDLQENQKKSTEFVRCFYENTLTTCSERNSCFVSPLKTCLTESQRITTLMCANGPQGIEYLFQNMKLTQKQKLTYVPSIELDGKLMTLGDRDDFGRLVCKKDQSKEICKNLKW